MATFALVSEGITDQIVLERIIEVVCAGFFDEGIDVNPLQPLRDATDSRTAPHGGWEKVLEYCERSATDALEANDYLVIHLDTDQGDHPNFGVALTEGGRDRGYDALVVDAIGVVKSRLGEELYKEHKDRLLFAICVHTMESWLLLYLCGRDEPKNSLGRLNKHLAKNDLAILSKEGKKYQKFCKLIKQTQLKELATTGSSFGLFLNQLEAISEVRAEVRAEGKTVS
ncbi:hypothetical protein [Bosea sp. (in: a-proteobacteria)]|jgi:hypothetical protein|uniref:hypothetical protein n=1 Tax=Bosea sp. (in: a-proteobacteria) TaxID=1871050 RepID=UPI003F6F9AEA